MEMLGYNTKVFKDIFSNYEDFNNWYLSTPLSKGSSPNETTFTLILYEYSCSHLSMDEEDFKQHFALELYTYHKEFEETTKMINQLLVLTDNEIAIADSTILNIANIPEVENSTDIEEVDFVSQQQKTIAKKGVLQIKKEQLANKRAFTTKTFLKRFKHLFIKILSPAYTNVVGEEEGE